MPAYSVQGIQSSAVLDAHRASWSKTYEYQGRTIESIDIHSGFFFWEWFGEL